VNDSHGTTQQPNCKYNCKDAIEKAFVHTYEIDTERTRTCPARLWILTLRDVSSGEEITAPYGDGYWSLCEEQAVSSNPATSATLAQGKGKKRKSADSAKDNPNQGKARVSKHAREEKSSLAPAKGLRRSRSQTQASLSALTVVDFCAEQVQAAFDIFDNREPGFGHVVVLKLQDDVGLKAGCDALLQTDHVFTSHTNAGITFQGLEKECFSRVEHGLHEHKVRRRRKEVFAEPLTTLVEAHFEGTAFKEAWDTVANIIKERWPKRQPLLVLMATGDCSKLSGHTTHGNVTFSASGQLVLCHFDGFHVVCFTVKGRKDFRVAKHADIEALPDSANANEAHHVSASHTDYAHLFSAAQVPEGHVMIMEVKTWHEVRSVLRHLRSVELSRVLNLVLVLYSHRCGRHPMAP